MFSGLPYVITVLLCGLSLGAILAPLARSQSNSELAQAFYYVTALLLSASYSINVWMILGHPPNAFTIIAKVFGAILSACFAAIFGIAIRRVDSRGLLGQPLVLDTIRMTVALTFAIAGIGKAFNMAFMTQFFTQSGYPITFLKFIMFAEVLGAIGLLLPWAFLLALLGFTVDMFGAIVTHVRNGDPLDDSAGAIAMLIRLIAIAALVVMTPQGFFAKFNLRRRVLIASSAGLGCLMVAIVGSLLLHSGK